MFTRRNSREDSRQKNSEKLEDYPMLTDPSLDFEATRQHFGIGTCNYAIREGEISSGKIVVYLKQQREGQEVVATEDGYRRICEHGIVICGYRAKGRGLLGFLKGPKIRLIPETEKQAVVSEIIKIIQSIGGRKPAYLDFW